MPVCCDRDKCEFAASIARDLTHDSFTGITIFLYYLLSLLKSRFYCSISILPSFALAIIGKTGSKKTTVTMAVCNPLHIDCCCFEDTKAAIGHTFQDNTNGCTVVDDFNCVTVAKNERFENIIRLCGDITSNARRVEGSKITSDVTTGMVVFTGEEEPTLQESSTSRMLMMKFDENTVNVEVLSSLQAKPDVYISFIVLFIQYVMSINDFDRQIASEVTTLRDEFRCTFVHIHDRYYEMCAWMTVMWRLFSKMLEHYGVCIEFDYETELREHIIAQHKHFHRDPVSMFLYAFQELMDSNGLTVIDYNSFKNGASFDVIDEDGSYFVASGRVFNKICAYYEQTEKQLGIGERSLRTALLDAGVLKKPITSKNTLTCERKTAANKSCSGYMIYKSKMNEIIGGTEDE